MIGYKIHDTRDGVALRCLYCDQGETVEGRDDRHLRHAGWLPVNLRTGQHAGKLAWVCPACRTTWERSFRPPPRSTRASDMVAMRLRGLTFEAIASEYGLTRERVRQIIKKEAPHMLGRRVSA
jgi:hypothetical protein